MSGPRRPRGASSRAQAEEAWRQSASEVEAGHPEQSQQEANDGGEDLSSAVELGDGIEKVLPVLFQGFDGDDRTEATPLPGRDRGAWDGEAAAQRRRA